MRPDSITLAIFEKYKPEEMAEVAQKMAQAQSDMEGAEAEKKVSDSVFNERIKKHAAEVSEHAQKYNKGGETAQIGCTIRYDIPSVGKKSYVRQDTEQTVEVHDMSLTEKQETLQFPLAAADDAPKPTKPRAKPATPAATPIEMPIETPASEITFKDIQSIAAHLANLPEEDRARATLDMQASISKKILEQKAVIGPDGRMESIDSPETAEKLAIAWMKLAAEVAVAPPDDEVTRLCSYPRCILFAEHDGEHEFPPSDAPPKAAEAAPEAQPQKETKPKRKKRPFATPPEPRNPTDPPQGAQA